MSLHAQSIQFWKTNPGLSACQASSALSHTPPLTGIKTYNQEFMTSALLSFNMGDQSMDGLKSRRLYENSKRELFLWYV